MIALVQRVASARVEVDERVTGEIGPGLLLFVCAEPCDAAAQAERLIQKVLKLRVFADDAGRMNKSLEDVRGGLLIVSQFTLAAELAGGNRPSFSAAAPPAQARALYDELVALARGRHAPVASGEFGAAMRVHMVGDGPVTIPLCVR